MNGIIPEFYDGDISGSVMVNGMNTFTTPIYKLSKNVGSVFKIPKHNFIQQIQQMKLLLV